MLEEWFNWDISNIVNIKSKGLNKALNIEESTKVPV